MLEKKALEYEEEQREIEKSKRKAKREAECKAELIKRQRILNTKKEIEKSMEE